MKTKLTIFVLFVLLFGSCNNSITLFQEVDSTDSNVTFVNQITESETSNVLVYEYFYNGGGVASGDFNNDGLQDLYFTANMGEDALYINKGNLEFEDISKTSGITWNKEWKTGVSLVDINKDGWLDIYISCSGNEESPELRKNKLYINQGNLTFKEEAEAYGLASDAFTTHAAFFDYDRDGDLDAYLLNHNVKDFKKFDVEAVHAMKDPFAGDQFFKNENGKFINITEEAGIKNNPIGFGLGINVSDLNGDNWPDIYISNDYIEGDYLYINQKDGTFKDEIKNKLDHTSYFSMGNDIADVNNDLLPDIFTSDMLPEDNERQKLLFGPEKYEGYLSMLRNGFLPEVMRNMLHLNNGDGTFSEIGQLAGISNTDWSWSPLIADFDNDGYKDLFITNGYLRDYTNNDFIKFYAEERSEGRDNVLDIINKMPSTKIPNYIFKNIDGKQFEDKRIEWGFEAKKISNGAIYVDLDNDGDLEIVSNNINETASIYVNKSKESHFLKIKLKGPPSSHAKVIVYTNGTTQAIENTSIHGFQSSIDAPIHFGLGKNDNVDSLFIIWNTGERQKVKGSVIRVNELNEISYQSSGIFNQEASIQKYFTQEEISILHEQQEINDFSRQILLPYMYSYQGPALASGDVNKDGIDDFFLGGGKGQAGRIFIGNTDGKFSELLNSTFKQDELTTDSDAQFGDFDGDGDLDLFVTGSGYEYLPNDLMLQNRLYLNNGKGVFEKDFTAFSPDFYADSKIELLDFDNDNDLDVFVGGFVIPLNFPNANPTRLYENQNGKLVLAQYENFENIGIVNDILATDLNNDGFIDLATAGEWQPIRIFMNQNGIFAPAKTISPNGLWQSLAVFDKNNDGKKEILAGNFGMNSQFKAEANKPMRLQIGDFDDNQRSELLLSNFIGDISYPFFSRDELADQLPMSRKLYTTYKDYSKVTSEQLIKDLKGIVVQELEVQSLASMIFSQNGQDWTSEILPFEFQMSPIYAFSLMDINKDGLTDVITGGNNYRTRVRIGNLDANHGQLFLSTNNGFEYISNGKSGLNFLGDVRGLAWLGNKLIAASNGSYLQIYSLNNDKISRNNQNLSK